ncbi:hypothetical protein O1R50_25770 [Glycomyces luteolus]|uniref:Uncharacterized protein n=1 Tax=Glycomyces luteolus TaxID=2670330 RepID=A0A9X3PG01_9ACTN|nr:hypothetical protein [Glycomyces luteolus]MDA1363047.1 hypothetical protein [Glycomyces luteolus]
MLISDLPARLAAMGIGTGLYSIGVGRENSLCIEQSGSSWVVYYQERGQWNNVLTFSDEDEVCRYVIGSFEEMLESRRAEGWPVEDLARERVSVEDRIRALGVGSAHYRIGEIADNAWCLIEEGGKWLVIRMENGVRIKESEFGKDFDTAESVLFRRLRSWQREQAAAGVDPEVLAADR